MRFIIFKPFINYIFRNLFQLDNFSKANTLITKGKQCPFYNCSMKAFSNISTHFTARHRKLKEKEIYKNSVLLKYKNKLPVIGVDINKAMLEHAKQKGNLKEYICVNLENITLTDNFADIVILSEIIEHVEDPQKVLEEATRIAKPNAKIIISVPYDSPLSLWYPLFNIQCLVYGYLLSKPFYKDFGGHIHHFTPGKIKQVIEKTKLKVIKQFHNKRFTIYTICTK